MSQLIEAKLRIYNWFYKLGSPLISDMKYNELFQQLKRENPNSEVITKTWSELEKPVRELEASRLLDRANEIEESRKQKTTSRFFLPEINMKYREEHYQESVTYFDQFIPKSIETIEDVSTAGSWLHSLQPNTGVKAGAIEPIEFNFSIKADGWNISLFYYHGYFIGARTRGRSGTSDDVTIAMSYVVPHKIDVVETYARIKVEAVMEKEALTELREMDKTREWKSPRNSMSTLLMNDIGEAFHKFIIPLAFKIEGKRFETLEDEMLWLERQGFKIVENETMEITSIESLLNTVKRFGKMELIYANDGCVVTVNNRALYETFETTGKYDYAMRAFRLFNWQSSIYCSVVLNVEQSYNSKQISLALNILPTKVSNGSTVATLDADNLSRIQYAKIKPGSVVAFHIRSDSCVDWLDYDSRTINQCLADDIPLPVKLIQPVAELEHRVMERNARKTTTG